MAEALRVGKEARFWASPNPAVGCVIVRDRAIIGSGFTQPAGGDHAEIQALKSAGDASGATVYVTLEPCVHQGRTGPCTEALIAAGVRRVVAAIEDPFEQVRGKGFARLKAAGVEVQVGVMARQAEADLAGFLMRMQRGWGKVRLKTAASMDGRTAMASGESQWITGPEARADVQLLRATSGAVVTGSGTVLADDCRLTLRADVLPLDGAALQRALNHPPLRVVLDTRGRVPDTAAVLSQEAPSIRFIAVDTVQANAHQSHDRSVVVPRQLEGEGLDLTVVMRWLGDRGCNDILVEAGSTLSGALLNQGLVDELVLYLAPKFLGPDGRPMAAVYPDQLHNAPHWVYRECTPIGEDLRIIAHPNS